MMKRKRRTLAWFSCHWTTLSGKKMMRESPEKPNFPQLETPSDNLKTRLPTAVIAQATGGGGDWRLEKCFPTKRPGFAHLDKKNKQKPAR
jgi:hypothetical protein